MKTPDQIKAAYARYLSQFPEENEALKILGDFITTTPSEALLYDRKNFEGHITASAFIVDQEKGTILVLEHKTLQRWLQPGGHVDAEDRSIISAVLRECKEETNIDPEQLTLFAGPYSSDIPIDLDSHIIPENSRKLEAQHYHHDFRYLFLYQGGDTIRLNPEESGNHQWLPFDQLEADPVFARVVGKIRRCFQG